jgi:hypothetical protein|tara:strand:- start:9697 stop:10764 length:1068 start_codon:yes stop_codon:yes gene_type:complete
MGKKKSSPPPAPDPAATAAAQAGVNKETAIAQARLNQYNEVTPFGTSVYTPTGQETDGIKQFLRTTTLDPAQQAILDEQTRTSLAMEELAGDQLGRVSESVSTPYSYEGFPEAPRADADARQQVIDSLYGQYKSRLDPRFSDERTALETRLATQGIPVGSDAYNKIMESQGRTRNDAYAQALGDAVARGGAEQSRLFGLGGSARDRAISEYERRRNAPLNEIAALQSGTQITNPSFSPTPNTAMANADITGPIRDQYMGRMAGYNAANQGRSDMMSGLFGLGAAALPLAFSDVRVKEDISKVGTLDNGLGVYSFRFKDGGPQQIGLIAQEVEKVNPGAVGEQDGIKTVNYEKAVL